MPRTNRNFIKSTWYRITLVISMLALAFGGQSTQVLNVQALSVAAPVPPSQISLNVISARTEPLAVALGPTGVVKGAVVSKYKWMINVDNAGTTEQRSPAPGTGCSPQDAGYPNSCNWTSIAGVQNGSFSPIFAQGDETDFALNGGPALPAGRYLISVMADGYKLDGAHFTVPTSGPVTVELQPLPLPDATVRARVFEDNAPTNSSPDEPAEHGLAGFQGHISDYLGEVTTDVYGSPLCTTYVGENPVTHVIDPIDLVGQKPVVDVIGGKCLSDANGDLVIPHLGPNRYALSAVAPLGSDWIQTTTLEGNHDWDAWVMEGSTGFDTEFVVAGEPFPATFFGFVHGTAGAYSFKTAGAGEIKGLAMGVKAYIPPTGGIGGEAGLMGGKVDKPIDGPWVSLSDINNGDLTVYTGKGNADGTFDIKNVPDGDYVLGVWDEPQDYIFDFQNVTIKNGELADLGTISMMGWWTTISGHVFNDLNGNGKQDPGEQGIGRFPITIKKRDNSVSDRGAVSTTTDQNGFYYFENAYPITQWLVEEAYVDGYQTTGVTYQADNQPTETTVLGTGVDVNFHPVIGLGGRLDWGVRAYPNGTNGGIVGTVTYDTTRNELDPRFAVTENWQPGIPGLKVGLYAPVDCPNDGVTPCDASGRYQLAADGSFAKGALLNTYVTETWQRPTGCVARDVNSNPLRHGIDENVLPLDLNADCIEAPMMGVQFGPMSDGTSFGASVDGNYGFGDACVGGVLDATDPANPTCTDSITHLPVAFTPLTPGDYLVNVVIPPDPTGRPEFKVTKEEDINIFHGDQFIPQIPPSECAGPTHIVDVKSTDGLHNMPDGANPIDNPDFANSVSAQAPGNNASPFEGQARPLCDTKLVRVSNRRSVAPNFNLFTDVPMPTRFWGLMVDDLNFSSNPKSMAYGEKLPVPFAPVGIYDYTNRLVDTVETDYNGIFDVLLPSTNRISCPTPSGVCANLYRLVGNDPGTPGHWNPNYNQQYRTIAAEFEGFPGLLIPVDLAPTPVAVAVQIPGIQSLAAISCTLDTVTPQLFAVDRPYANISAGPGAFTITGVGFGAVQGSGKVTLDGVALPVSSWNDRQISVTIPANSAFGPHQLSVKSGNGQTTVNGLTFHVVGSRNLFGAFPSTAVLDNFNGRLAFGSNWHADNLFNNLVSVFNVASFVPLPPTALNYLKIDSGNSTRSAWYGPGTGTVFGSSQEAYFTFTQVSTQGAASSEQGLLLKLSGFTTNNQGLSNLTANAARWVEVSYNRALASVQVFSKTGNNSTVVTGPSFPATFAAGDKLGARALSDGTIIAYKNNVEIGRTTIAATAALTGRIGIRFRVTGTAAATDAQIDDFGGGNVAATTDAYLPSIFEVGPGHTYATIQRALDAAAASPAALVVVYPGAVDLSNPRYNGRGSYYENIIIHSPVKLQGVGPGGVYPDGTPVQGTIIDGIGFGGDTQIATDWLAKVGSLTWDGNQNVFDGQVMYVLAHNGQFTSSYKAAIDGFDIRGGDQMGLPGNLNAIFGGYPGPNGPVAVETQGGAIFANAYASYLQITNNTIQNNGGAYGSIRIGTPNLAGQNNDHLRIANNRIIANGGTNLAGAIGLFAGSDNYEVASNDICGNFSAEYGGGISHFGLSPNGKIHDNRIYFNASYDEGAGIMVAGELPIDPTANYGAPNGAKGSGAVDIYNNMISSNLADDDGGGIRFLMAGNFPMNVYNNMIVNNISTHEGGGIAVDDAPNVNLFNNTIMKNITTATAITSNGQPAPAGLSTGQNSAQLQASLPLGSASFSNPFQFNNIFWDNRAGTRGLNMVTGIGAAGDATPINNWDMGTFDAISLLSPTNSILQSGTGVNTSPTNKFLDPQVISPFDVGVTFTSWRNNINMVGAIMVTADLPPTLMGNYHIPLSSPAVNSAASSKLLVNAPAIDYDHEGRPGGGGFDIGADEADGVAGGAIVAFPQTQVLDNFNRADNTTLGTNWTNPSSGYRVNTNNAQVRSGASPVLWTSTVFGSNQEDYFKFVKVASVSDQSLILKFNGLTTPSAADASLIQVTYNANALPASVSVWTKAPLQGWVQRATFPVSFAATDIFGARALADGSVRVYKNGAQIGITDVTAGANPWAASLTQWGGKIGVWFVGTTNSLDARFDDFGGGTLP